MQFKTFLYWTAVLSGIGQILVALYSRYYGSIAELIQSAQPPGEIEMAVVKALNYALPLGVGCLALLLYTRKQNTIAADAMLLAIALQVAGAHLNISAVKSVLGEEATLASVTWWAPK